MLALLVNKWGLLYASAAAGAPFEPYPLHRRIAQLSSLVGRSRLFETFSDIAVEPPDRDRTSSKAGPNSVRILSSARVKRLMHVASGL